MLSWEKHQKIAAQRELQAAIHGARSLPENNIGVVHNFQDVLTKELDEFVPGTAYFRRRDEENLHKRKQKVTQCKLVV